MGNFQTVHRNQSPPPSPPPEYIEDFVNLTEDEKTIVTTYITETIDEIKDHVKYDNEPISFVFPVALKVNENKYFYLVNALSGKCLKNKHIYDIKEYNKCISYYKLFYIVNNKIKEYTNKPYIILRNIVRESICYNSSDDKASKPNGISYYRGNAYDIFYLNILFVQ